MERERHQQTIREAIPRPVTRNKLLIVLSSSQLDAIQQFDTCTIANATEQFGVRLRNVGFTRPGLRCVTDGGARLLGYASTSRVRTSNPPVTGEAYLDRTDWW